MIHDSERLMSEKEMKFHQVIKYSLLPCRQSGFTSVMSVRDALSVAKLYGKEGN